MVRNSKHCNLAHYSMLNIFTFALKRKFTNECTIYFWMVLSSTTIYKHCYTKHKLMYKVVTHDKFIHEHIPIE